MDKIKFKELKIHKDDRGYLFETLRNDDELFDGKFGQAIISVVYPGIIKAWHLHHKQTDYTICIKGNIKYGVAKELENGKVDIKTFSMGEDNLVMIKVPPELWHGYTPIGNKEAILLHIFDNTYNPEDTDTEAKDAMAFGDIWSVKSN